MIFDRKNETTSEQEVKRFELMRGIRLPSDCRNFLLEFNGGHPANNNVFWQAESSNWLDVEEFYGFTNSTFNSVEADRFYNFSNALRAKLLQIGHSYGSGFYIDLREGPMHGKIYILVALQTNRSWSMTEVLKMARIVRKPCFSPGRRQFS